MKQLQKAFEHAQAKSKATVTENSNAKAKLEGLRHDMVKKVQAARELEAAESAITQAKTAQLRLEAMIKQRDSIVIGPEPGVVSHDVVEAAATLGPRARTATLTAMEHAAKRNELFCGAWR